MAEPIAVGILHDMAAGPPAVSDIEQWLRLAVDEALAAGRLDRDVAFVSSWGRGLPGGTAAAVERAFRALAAQDVLLIVGPAIGDNALVATPLADALAIPTINWAGTERARSDWMFHLQVGSHEDEPILLARHMAGLGAGRVGVVYDRSVIGRRYLAFFLAEAERLGLSVATAESIAVMAEDASAEVAAVRAVGVDGLVYLGLGVAAPAVARAAAGWNVPRAMNTAGLRGYHGDFARVVDGWAYVDMHADDNATLVDLRDRLALPVSKSLAAAKGYDLGRLVAEGIARATELTRAGVRDGLEQVKWLPAAEGHEGTLLCFGTYDRGALHGRYLVMRQWRGGESVQLG